GIDKSLPKVRWLQDVHVAVQHFESVFGHGSSALQRLFCVWMGGNVFRCPVRVHSVGAYLYLCRLFLELKSSRVGSLVPPTAVDGCDENLFRDICQRQRNV